VNYLVISILVLLIVIIGIGYWWRTHSLACPASVSWLVDNPFMNAIAGPEIIFQRMQLDDGMIVLDVGSGPGRLTLPAAKLVGERGEVVALDIQQKMLTKLQHRLEQTGIKNVSLIHAGAGKGKIQDDYFDRAILVTVLGEIPNQQQAIDEIYTALKPGGILSVTELVLDPHYTSKKKLRGLCKKAGFSETALYAHWWTYTMNFKK